MKEDRINERITELEQKAYASALEYSRTASSYSGYSGPQSRIVQRQAGNEQDRRSGLQGPSVRQAQ